MKRKLLSNFGLLGLLFSLLVLSGCKKDSDYPVVNDKNPEISLSSSHIRTEAGREFVIKGYVEDLNGISSIRLFNDQLDLDKTIDLLKIYDELVTKYDLNYKFKTPKTQQGDNFVIEITVTDVLGRVTTSQLTVSMDGDFDPPFFTSGPGSNVIVLIKADTKFKLSFSVEDKKELDYVEISIEELSYVQRETVSGRTFSFLDQIDLPSQEQELNLTIVAYDKAGLSVERKTVIKVSDLPDFAKMYIVDVQTIEELNSSLFGIPQLIERTGAFQYRARYYSEKAGTEVRFIPQKTDFSPICFGVDADDETVLADDPEVSQPIVLEQVGYYEINFDTKQGTYSVAPYTPSDIPLPIGEPMSLNPSDPDAPSIPFQIALIGAGLPGVGNWSPSNPFILTLSEQNPFLFFAEMELEAGTEIEFTIGPKHDWGWWPEPFWRFEGTGGQNSGENEYNVKNGGDNMKKVTVRKDGKYIFKFDTHLLRSRFYQVN